MFSLRDLQREEENSQKKKGRKDFISYFSSSPFTKGKRDGVKKKTQTFDLTDWLNVYVTSTDNDRDPCIEICPYVSLHHM